MTKYSEEFKQMIVNEYLENILGYSLLAKKYDISNPTPIKQWVKAYKHFGKEGLKSKHTKQVYSVQFKLDVLHFMKRTGASYQKTALTFEMNNPSVIVNWNRIFQREGIEGLKPKQKGRPSMSKQPKKKKMAHKHTSSREKDLERENELLRLENAYLKKLKAFEENPNAFLEKHKQRWHSSSKKKGTD